MQMKKTFYRDLMFLLILSGILFFCETVLRGAQIDSFYLNLLEKGEKSFKAGHFQDAADKLKIAIFGLQKDKPLVGKACVYLGISYFYLKNREETEKYLRQAFQLLGKDGIENLGLDHTDMDILEKLFSSLKIGDYKSLKLSPLEVKTLESAIKTNPRNTDAYYELYNHYQQVNDLNKTKKILEKLIKKNPREMHGYYKLGLLTYELKKYKDAIKHLTKFFELAAATSQLDEDISITAHAIAILSAHYKGDKKRTMQLSSESREFLTPSSIENLPLSATDRTTLLQIMNNIK